MIVQSQGFFACWEENSVQTFTNISHVVYKWRTTFYLNLTVITKWRK